MIPLLTDQPIFPDIESALRNPNGLLAAGGDLSTPRLLAAYRKGIFPWFGEDDPILWWSPDPRMVMFPGEFRSSRSLSRALDSKQYEVSFDADFIEVIQACAAPRAKQGGTWISEEIVSAYSALHQEGNAHSVEVRCSGQLVGGLYGVSIGRMFFGESMFSRQSNTSKIALAYLCRQLSRWNFGMIDCQMSTSHLASLGAREIPRTEFISRLQDLIHYAPVPRWQFDADLFE